MQATVGRLPEAQRRDLFARFGDGLWCSIDAISAALAQFDRELGTGDNALAAGAGRHFARAHFGAQPALELRVQTPEFFFSGAPDVFKHYIPASTARVLKVGRGYGRLEIRGQAAARLPLSIAMLGFIEEGIKLFGGSAVAVRLSQASAAGDGADVYEATWRT